ncbi:hypothetical protein GCM10027053_37940 [Intrasporangium mesophilum]
MTEVASAGGRHRSPVAHTGADPDVAADDVAVDEGPSWLVRDPVRTAALAIAVISLAIRASVLKDGYFLTDDFMLTTRAVENDFGYSYLTRVHTGHFEPIGFAFMWVFAHLAALDWTVAVLAIIAAQAVLSFMVWRLLTELFGRRAMTLLPFAVFSISTLTLPTFSWLSAAIIWAPLMIAMAGVLRHHTRYLRTHQTRNLAGAGIWLLVGMASFEKVLVLLPYLVAFSFVVLPSLRMRWTALRRFVRATLPLWLVYGACTAAYLGVYVTNARHSDVSSGLRSPGVGTLGEFAYRTVLQTFVPGALGGPWEWTPVSSATAIVSSPRGFEWGAWVVAAAVVGASLVLRRRAVRAWVSLGVYLFFSILALGVSRVPLIGSVAGLETRYVADAVIPLVITIGFCVMPVQGERQAWYATPYGLPAETFRRVKQVCVASLLAVMLALSLHAMSGYATFHASNPYRAFVENARAGFAALPDGAQVYDTALPVDVVGPLFLDYNRVSRFLAPFTDARGRAALYETTEYTKPYVLKPDGTFAPMRVDGIGSPAPLGGTCGWSDASGRVVVPLAADVFAWSWAMRIGYLADGDASAVVHLGKGSVPIRLHQGLGEVFIPITGGGNQVELTDLTPGVRVCVGDIQVGNPVPKA